MILRHDQLIFKQIQIKLNIEEEKMSISPTTAQKLWIEAEPLSGGSHSQVEFPAELHEFFSLPGNPDIGDEVQRGVIYQGITFTTKKMDFHHNDVWRLNLPTQNQGICGYAGTILTFEKTANAEMYILEIIHPNDPTFTGIRQDSVNNNSLGYRKRNDGSNREYGLN